MEHHQAPKMIITVGVLGQGRLGQYLVEKILKEGDSLGFRLAFVWSRTGELALQRHFTPKEMCNIPVLEDLARLDRWPTKPSLIVEVCHPNIIRQHGVALARVADLMIGSPTALADVDFERRVRVASHETGHRVYVPAGTLWPASPEVKNAKCEQLAKQHMLLYYHPRSIHLTPPSSKSLSSNQALCPYAPRSVGSLRSIVWNGQTLNGIISCPHTECAYHRIEVTLANRTDLEYENGTTARKQLASASNFYIPEPSVFGQEHLFTNSPTISGSQMWNSLLSKRQLNL